MSADARRPRTGRTARVGLKGPSALRKPRAVAEKLAGLRSTVESLIERSGVRVIASQEVKSAQGQCFQTPSFLPRGTPNAAPERLGSVFDLEHALEQLGPAQARRSVVRTVHLAPGGWRSGRRRWANGYHIASHLQRTLMKTSSFPSLRVEPELREAAESVLRDGETLTSLIETSVRETIQRRRVQEEFIARGLRSRDDAERTGIYHSVESVHSELQQRLDARRKSVLG